MEEAVKNMKRYFQERIDKDFIESEDMAIDCMKVALKYIKQLEENKKRTFRGVDI